MRNVSASIACQGGLRCDGNRCEKPFKLGFGIDVRDKGGIDALPPPWHRRCPQQPARDGEEKQACQRAILFAPRLITRRASVHEARDHLRVDISDRDITGRLINYGR